MYDIDIVEENVKEMMQKLPMCEYNYEAKNNSESVRLLEDIKKEIHKIYGAFYC